jgi:TRAP-type C4-dicarboxylate transport system substrate-binding protein
LHKRLVEAASEIATKSDGRIELSILPDSQLGGQLGLMSQVRGAGVEMAALTGQSLANDLGPLFVSSVGFAFDGYDKLWPAMDGDLGKAIRQQIELRLGMSAMSACWDLGFRQITTRKQPVRVAADLEGLKIRTPVDADMINLLRALKAAPLGLRIGELLPALRVGAIDAQEGSILLIDAAGLTEQQASCSLTNHVWDGQWLCANTRVWNQLPNPLKDVVAEALDAAGQRQRTDVVAQEAEVRQDLTKHGMTFNTVDPASFQSALRTAGYYGKAKVRVGDALWGVLEKYTGRLL